ncbi:hypothetical protein [Hymenobacter actinosclerus]|uniref:hypothetical protein n=1 Tax=Hymenobacter actinosclerus TaxID=82805 RepID=UPI0011605065|nr:hypothetical protein [Hymenobacter actinosclerus]
MRNYTLAAIYASTAGWLVATAVYAAGHFFLRESQTLEAIQILTPITLVISALANIFLVQLPRYFVKKAFFKFGRLGFALIYSLCAYVVFSLLFGRSFGLNPIEQLTYLNAATNGFVLGWVFYTLWKPELI